MTEKEASLPSPSPTVRRYDLEDRTEEFAKAVIQFCKGLPKDIINHELVSLVVRSSGSVGANYIEANDCLSRKDFVNRIRICRKEAKESRYWLRLIASANPSACPCVGGLEQESTELMNIFGAILKKTTV
jgi:four helix bundle protein